MRPPKESEKGVVLVLDTLPECQVLLNTLEARQSLFAVSDTNSADSVYDTRMRFEEQTYHLPLRTSSEKHVAMENSEYIMGRNPEFKVEPQDIEVVMLAAQRVLDERRISVKMRNRLAGRTKAAKAIVKALDDVIFKIDR